MDMSLFISTRMYSDVCARLHTHTHINIYNPHTDRFNFVINLFKAMEWISMFLILTRIVEFIKPNAELSCSIELRSINDVIRAMTE